MYLVHFLMSSCFCYSYIYVSAEIMSESELIPLIYINKMLTDRSEAQGSTEVQGDKSRIENIADELGVILFNGLVMCLFLFRIRYLTLVMRWLCGSL